MMVCSSGILFATRTLRKTLLIPEVLSESLQYTDAHILKGCREEDMKKDPRNFLTRSERDVLWDASSHASLQGIASCRHHSLARVGEGLVISVTASF